MSYVVVLQQHTSTVQYRTVQSHLQSNSPASVSVTALGQIAVMSRSLFFFLSISPPMLVPSKPNAAAEWQNGAPKRKSKR